MYRACVLLSEDNQCTVVYAYRTCFIILILQKCHTCTYISSLGLKPELELSCAATPASTMAYSEYLTEYSLGCVLKPKKERKED